MRALSSKRVPLSLWACTSARATKIYDRETGEVFYGRVPAGSVVVSGNLPSKDGKYSLYCAVIVKKVDAKTRGKVGINELLRTID
ncbi:2,3,4,5-tetrahydropyridine-2,6-dicarboxylate N-succinyltransferase [Klebsiella grimontii]|uniref:2,3,4,5-tetrahydropyridine-2,6-dicarboxylate N-succinyltransferase n=1 Tax=Klebsiella grimontii TaxID=2058152 RepID=A0A7H4P9W9_9ENTR|nr:2,3,4,5-tetrahydropyridine-2,6-dicarboxylate N-succinyltransferase [Klebsiella grimontii]